MRFLLGLLCGLVIGSGVVVAQIGGTFGDSSGRFGTYTQQPDGSMTWGDSTGRMGRINPPPNFGPFAVPMPSPFGAPRNPC